MLVAAALSIASTAGAAPASDAPTPGQRLSEALERERSGVDVPWSDDATGHKGVIRIERTFYRGQQPCRDYVWTRESASGGKDEIRGTGCRVAKAKWETEEKPVAAAAPPALSLGSSTSPSAAPAPSGGSAAAAKPAESPRAVRKPPPLIFTVPPRSDL